MRIRTLSLALLACCVGMTNATATATTASPVSRNDVTWTTAGHDENDSMPIGNGDLAANVWTESGGDVVLLVSKADAWSELNKLLKLGRIRIRLTPNPFRDGGSFEQSLRLEDATIEIRCGGNTIRVWVDANHPVLHVTARLKQPTTLTATVELWRTQAHPYDTPSPDKGGSFGLGKHPIPLDFTADTVFPARSGRLAWAHFNTTSLYPLVLRQQHLESLASRFPDPLLHRSSGAALSGPGLVTDGDRQLKSIQPGIELHLDLTALTTTHTDSPGAWYAQLASLLERESRFSPAPARAAHERWWRDFWERSWIRVSGTSAAEKVSQGFAMQRYMMAASSRGAFPTKYNGGLFTVGHDMPPDVESTPRNHNPDFRSWGGSYWNQNNRLLYWPLIPTGDFDLVAPWFNLYLNALPLARQRTQAYFHHPGAAFIETIDFWGLPNLNDFGRDNPTTQVDSHWMRYHVQGGLEVLAQMLDAYNIRQDEDFARTQVVPFADPIVTYYARHWHLDPSGTLRIAPAQSLETYQLDAVNPTPDIAALRHVLAELLTLPSTLTTEGERSGWRALLRELPPIPVGTTAANGKIPPFGRGDPHGRRVILPAASYSQTKNVENPELYTVFPYRLYGVGKPDLALARDTFAARLFPQDTCWGQDGPQAAQLGLTEVAEQAAIHEFTHYGEQRFQWFWTTAHDWTPDLDNGGTGMITLETMLMQVEGARIQLLPAWPKEWTADFKLHAPFRTTVSGHVENGKLSHLKVEPASRTQDVTLVSNEVPQ